MRIKTAISNPLPESKIKVDGELCSAKVYSCLRIQKYGPEDEKGKVSLPVCRSDSLSIRYDMTRQVYI